MTHNYGDHADGASRLYKIVNKAGAELTLTDRGAALHELKVPDKDGALVDIALSYRDPGERAAGVNLLGSALGRVAFRISNARFSIGGETYRVKSASGEYAEHGGLNGFSSRLWNGREIGNSVVFKLNSPSGDMGFPGNLRAEISYTLHDDNRLRIDYEADSDADTCVSLCVYTAFNLAGHASGGAPCGELKVDGEYHLPADSRMCPTGEYKKGSDYAGPAFVLAGSGDAHTPKASAFSEASGIFMTVYSDMPVISVSKGEDMLALKGKDGAAYFRGRALRINPCLFPDSLNRPEFPDQILRKGKTYRYFTEYVFTTGDDGE